MRESTVIVFCVGFFFLFVMFCVYQDETTKRAHIIAESHQGALLHVCFPNGVYKADALPECPELRREIIEEANKWSKD